MISDRIRWDMIRSYHNRLDENRWGKMKDDRKKCVQMKSNEISWCWKVTIEIGWDHIWSNCIGLDWMRFIKMIWVREGSVRIGWHQMRLVLIGLNQMIQDRMRSDKIKWDFNISMRLCEIRWDWFRRYHEIRWFQLTDEIRRDHLIPD